MAEIKQPSDRKPKADKVKATDYFSFQLDGETYTMPNKTNDIITFGFIRKNRRRDEIDYVMTCIEALSDGDDDILDKLDAMSNRDNKRFVEDFLAHLGASLGE
jgi:hypothetical protein